ncbi:acyl-CoA synthetase [Salinirubellus sp. GCM10025818]|uniref:acyl-CoA synthetase n=1 Tax=Salinirubellus TaxID=2162630 RepID=UPI0030D3E15B
MTDTPRLDAYHFHEEEWEDYDALRAAFDWEVPDRFNIAAYTCDRWADERGRVALFYEDGEGQTGTYTFRQLRDAANRLANHLADAGVERGDRIGVNAPQRPETVISHLAAWKLGATSIPLSTLFGPDGLRYRLDDASAVAAVVDRSNVEAFREARSELPDLHTALTIDAEPGSGEADFDDALSGSSPQFVTVDTGAEDESLLIYTSGTTGDPKGVRHVHRVLLGHLPLFLTTFANLELTDRDVFRTPSEWAWIASLFDVVFPALYYGRPVLAYRGGQFDPERAFELIERYDVTNYFAPPTALRMMQRVDAPERFDVDSIRTITSGGEALGRTIAEWADETFAGAVVHEGYGQTEANVLAGECTALFESREGSFGLAGPGHELAIVDPETAEPTVPPGETGEIAVRYEGDPVCFTEYWNQPGKTDAKIRNGWLLTEDLGTVDEDRYLSFVGRKDDVIISAGYRIGPEEIEDSLAAHPAVADAAVIGVPDDERGEVPKAFVVLAAGYEPGESLVESLQEHVKARLAKYEYPREIEFVEELPTTTTGKIRRTSLREREGIE